jgi:hypothetical protein
VPHTLIIVTIGVVIAAIGLLGLWCLRWRYLVGKPGFFPCVLVDGEGAGRRERHGLAAFTGPALVWFARDSLKPTPSCDWPRQGLSIRARSPEGAAAGWQVVHLASGGRTWLLVISQSACSGLLSWIEAGPTRSE